MGQNSTIQVPEHNQCVNETGFDNDLVLRDQIFKLSFCR